MTSASRGGARPGPVSDGPASDGPVSGGSASGSSASGDSRRGRSVPRGPAPNRAPVSAGEVSPRRRALWPPAVAALFGACVLLGGAASPAVAGGSLITVIDNSHSDSLVSTDSLLEIDKSGNLQSGQGTAGSDQGPANALVGTVLGIAPVTAVDSSAGSDE